MSIKDKVCINAIAYLKVLDVDTEFIHVNSSVRFVIHFLVANFIIKIRFLTTKCHI